VNTKLKVDLTVTPVIFNLLSGPLKLTDFPVTSEGIKLDWFSEAVAV
jgi:hypothetical protein